MYQFGDLLYYTSPLNLHKTRCVYVRDDAGKAVVLFMHAEFVARVNYAYLSTSKETDQMKTYTIEYTETNIGYFDVEAESEEEALDEFWYQVGEGSIDLLRTQIMDSNAVVQN